MNRSQRLIELVNNLVEIDEKDFWDKDNPKSKHKKMTPAMKRRAKARAKSAGRPWPNLVDNAAVMKGE